MLTLYVSLSLSLSLALSDHLFSMCILSLSLNDLRSQQQWWTNLVPLPLSVQSDDDHGGVDQVSIAVEREVVVLPAHAQHVSEIREREKQRKVFIFCRSAFIHTDV